VPVVIDYLKTGLVPRLGGLLLLLLGIGLSVPVVIDYLHTSLVPRLPTAVLSAAIVEIAVLSMVCGSIRDSVARGRKETKRLAYLSIPAAGAEPRPVGHRPPTLTGV
jgi:hypothetical protein